MSPPRRYPSRESGFYYLQSRYYDPSIGRFINADGEIKHTLLEGLNIFSYCGNIPTTNTDVGGNRHVKGIDACGTSGTMDARVVTNTDMSTKQRKGSQTIVTERFYTKESAQSYVVDNIPQLEDPVGTIMGAMTGFSYVYSHATKGAPQSLISKVASSSWELGVITLAYNLALACAINHRDAQIKNTLEEIRNLPNQFVYVEISVWDNGSLSWEVGVW